jgi:hypothetical protein
MGKKGRNPPMAKVAHRMRRYFLCISLGLFLLLILNWTHAHAAGGTTEQGTKPQGKTEGQAPGLRTETEGKDAQPQATPNEVPGPIRFELTSRMELKYEQISYEVSGHVHRFLFSGSYAFSNMSIGIDELPIIKVDTAEHPGEDYTLGDVIFRWGCVPYLASSQDFGAILVTNLTWPTGDFDEGASCGRYDLEPRLFLPYRVNRRWTIVPALYEKFTLEKKEKLAPDSNLLTLRLINIIYPSPTTYCIAEPRFYYDFVADRPSGEIRFSIGTMLKRNLTGFLEYSAGLGVSKLFESKAACGLRYFFR